MINTTIRKSTTIGIALAAGVFSSNTSETPSIVQTDYLSSLYEKQNNCDMLNNDSCISNPNFTYNTCKNELAVINMNDNYLNVYDEALNIFGTELRDFTEEEKEAYEKSLNKIYKPIGVNILDL